MTERQAQLWQTLADLPLGDADAAVTFEDKLLRQTGWPRPLARRAIDEYRRYLLLAATAGHAVSPSPAVDEVWHLHLLYTRHYWKTLCAEVLGFDFHHEPATGRADNRGRLDDAYAFTRASYRDAFGEPPADLWPQAAAATRVVRVDRDRVVVLPRAVWRVLVAVIAALTLLLLACVFWIASIRQGGLG